MGGWHERSCNHGVSNARGIIEAPCKLKQRVNTVYYICLLGSSLQIISSLCILSYHLPLLLSPPPASPTLPPDTHAIKFSFVSVSDFSGLDSDWCNKVQYTLLPQSLVFRLSLWLLSPGKLRNWSVEIHIPLKGVRRLSSYQQKTFHFGKEWTEFL